MKLQGEKKRPWNREILLAIDWLEWLSKKGLFFVIILLMIFLNHMHCFLFFIKETWFVLTPMCWFLGQHWPWFSLQENVCVHGRKVSPLSIENQPQDSHKSFSPSPASFSSSFCPNHVWPKALGLRRESGFPLRSHSSREALQWAWWEAQFDIYKKQQAVQLHHCLHTVSDLQEKSPISVFTTDHLGSAVCWIIQAYPPKTWRVDKKLAAETNNDFLCNLCTYWSYRPIYTSIFSVY